MFLHFLVHATPKTAAGLRKQLGLKDITNSAKNALPLKQLRTPGLPKTASKLRESFVYEEPASIEELLALPDELLPMPEYASPFEEKDELEGLPSILVDDEPIALAGSEAFEPLPAIELDIESILELTKSDLDLGNISEPSECTCKYSAL